MRRVGRTRPPVAVRTLAVEAAVPAAGEGTLERTAGLPVTERWAADATKGLVKLSKVTAGGATCWEAPSARTDTVWCITATGWCRNPTFTRCGSRPVVEVAVVGGATTCVSWDGANGLWIVVAD